MLRAVGATSFVVWLAYTVAVGSGAVPDGTEPRSFGGDFPAFYGAGRVVLEGRGRELYVPAIQQESQRGILRGAGDGEYLMFAYPPAFAIPYAGMATLPFGVAYALQCGVMLLALALTIVELGRRFRAARNDAVTVFLGSLAVFPVFVGAFLGQNGLLSLLLVTWSWRLADEQRDASAGFAAACLLYKPQIALPWLGILLLSRRWRAAAGFLGGAALFFAACSGVAGLDWFPSWLSWAVRFQSIDGLLNGHKMISWPSVIEAVVQPSIYRDVAIWLPLIALAFPSIVVLARLRDRPAAQLALALPLMVFASPHALRYELALLVPTALFVGERSRLQLAAIVFLAMASEYTRWAGVACLLLAAGLVGWHAVCERPASAPRERLV